MSEEVERAELIATREEAIAYYRARLAMAHTITCYEKRVTIVFERDATHLYSVGLKEGESVDAAERVTRILSPKKTEVRRFSVERARLMDRVLPAVSLFVVSVPESGGRHAMEKRVLYGPALPSGDSMRVVLRPGPGEAWTCVSAYPVSATDVMAARRLKRANFPP